MIVAKFGGTSVATQSSAKNIKRIIEQNNNIKFVVVSAIGKSENYTQKVTDLLYKVYHLYKSNEDFSFVIYEIIERYNNLAKQLNIKINFEKEQQKILNRLKSKMASKEYIVSRGEYLSAMLYSKFLQGQFLDASDYIIFKSNGEINFKQTKRRLKTLKMNNLYIIGGFYGATKNGQIKVFSRGGSDITGAVISKVLNAEIYQNYTDVDGVFDKNPKIFKNAKQLPILNYKTAYGMADAGNEVVHKTALQLLKQTNTVLIVKNTFSKDFGSIVVDADYILDNLFVCKIFVKVLKFVNLTKEQRKQLFCIGRLKKIIKHDIYFYAIFEELYISKNKCMQITNCIEFFECLMFTFFSNIKINDKNIKILEKISKKLKNHVIFAKFLSNSNNFVVLANNCDENKILFVTNKYLQ